MVTNSSGIMARTYQPTTCLLTTSWKAYTWAQSPMISGRQAGEAAHLQSVSLYGYRLVEQAVRGTAHPVRLVGRMVRVGPRVATRSLQVT